MSKAIELLKNIACVDLKSIYGASRVIKRYPLIFSKNELMLKLSIQASEYNYSLPKESLNNILDYDCVEFAFIFNGNFQNYNSELVNKYIVSANISDSNDDVFGYVEIDKVIKLINNLLDDNWECINYINEILD